MTNDKNPEEVLAESKEKKRVNTNPATNGSVPALEDAIVQAFEEIDAGDRPQNLTLRDEKLAALFGGLEDAEQLQRVMTTAAEQIGADVPEKSTRANALRMVLRAGLVDVAPDVVRTSKDARDRYEESNDVL